MIEILVPMEIPSQNVTDHQHWAARARFRDNFIMFLRSRGGNITSNMATGPRKLLLTCYRKRLITDDANLRGGAKSAVDAIVRTGLLLDDKDTMAHIEYRQVLASKHPTKKPCTLVTLTDIP